jgi:hypothetical protein
MGERGAGGGINIPTVKRYEAILVELKEHQDNMREAGMDWNNYRKAFENIMLLNKAEEGCTLKRAKEVTAHWWDDSKGGILNQDHIFTTCHAMYPLEALKRRYLDDLEYLGGDQIIKMFTRIFRGRKEENNGNPKI